MEISPVYIVLASLESSHHHQHCLSCGFQSPISRITDVTESGCKSENFKSTKKANWKNKNVAIRIFQRVTKNDITSFAPAPCVGNAAMVLMMTDSR